MTLVGVPLTTLYILGVFDKQVILESREVQLAATKNQSLAVGFLAEIFEGFYEGG
jgi:hypothetical protein